MLHFQLHFLYRERWVPWKIEGDSSLLNIGHFLGPSPEFSWTHVCLSVPDSGLCCIYHSEKSAARLHHPALRRRKHAENELGGLLHPEHPTGNPLPSIAHSQQPHSDKLLQDNRTQKNKSTVTVPSAARYLERASDTDLQPRAAS